MKRESLIGKEILRVDGPNKIYGSAVYTGDLELAGMLEADILISPHPYARILSVDVSKAAGLEGVLAVITGEDVQENGLYGTAIKDRPILAKDFVRFAGEPVAAVAAINKNIARQALELIEVEYEEMEGVFDPELAAAPNAPLLHENLASYSITPIFTPQPGTNICNNFKIRKGDVEKGFSEADHIFEDTYQVPRNHHAALETHSLIAQFEKEGNLQVWVSNQSPYVLQRALSEQFKLPRNKVRVTIPTLGGGFGGKIYPSIEPIAVALAQRTKGRPVRLALDREKDFTSSVTNHGAKVKIKTGVKRDGTLIARQLITYWDTGAYADCGPLVSRNSGFTSAGPYRIENVQIDAYAVYTNLPVASAFRGYGIPHVTWAYECQMERIAHELGLDPLEIRLKNLIDEGDLSHTGEKMVAVGLRECIEKVAQAAGWEAGKAPQAIALGDGRYRSLGLSCSWKGSMPHYASLATVRVFEDGSVEVNSSNVDMGQGSATIWTQMVAEELGVPLERIEVRHPDTFVSPYDRTTSASRGTFHAGTAVMNAAKDAWRQMAELAAKVFQCQPSEVVKEDGFILNPQTGQKFSHGEIINKAIPGGADVIGNGASMMTGTTGLDKETGQGERPTSFWMYSAQIADAEVDTRTGKITIHKIIAAIDVGKAINRENCMQQIQGGVAMGMGVALFEELRFNKGRNVNNNYHDYKIPTAADVPPIETILVEVPHPDGPYGAKGIGEVPVGPVAPAIANAVANASGIWLRSTPMTPERVLEAIRKAAE